MKNNMKRILSLFMALALLLGPIASTSVAAEFTVETPIEEDSIVSGTGTPGASISIRIRDGGSFGTTTVNSDGTWKVSRHYKLGLNNYIIVKHEINGEEKEIDKRVEERALSEAPIVDEILENTEIITGKGVPGAEITLSIKDSGGSWRTTVASDGTWRKEILGSQSLTVGRYVIVNQTQEGKKAHSVDIKIIERGEAGKPTVREVYAGDDRVVGLGVPGAKIQVDRSKGDDRFRNVGNDTVKYDGQWRTNLRYYGDFEVGEYIRVTQTVEGKNPSVETIKVKDPSSRPKAANYRISGKNRLETSIEVSKKYYQSADTVVIVDASKFPDALSASVLAKILDAPILLTNSASLDSSVVSEINRLGAKKFIAVGGTAAISRNVENELKRMGSFERIYGSDRFETSAAVARKIMEMNGGKKTAVIANGMNFADALSVAPLAAKEEAPILLIQKDTIPTTIQNVISEKGIDEVYISGGTAAVSRTVERNLPKLIKRLSGKDRYETAVSIAEEMFYTSEEIFVASGTSWADALVIGPVGGKENAPILLTPGGQPTSSLVQYTEKTTIKTITAVGGSGVINDSVLSDLIK